MTQESQREYEGIFLLFSIYCLFHLLSIMHGKTPLAAYISVAKPFFSVMLSRRVEYNKAQMSHIPDVDNFNILAECVYLLKNEPKAKREWSNF